MGWDTAIALDSLSEVARSEGSFREALALAEEAQVIYRELADQSGIAWSLYNLAYVAHYEQRHGQAKQLFTEALALRHEQGNKEGFALALAGLAATEAVSGRTAHAACLFGAADLLLDAGIGRMSPFDRADYEQNREAVRIEIGSEEYSAAWHKGQEMSPEQVVAYASQDD